MVRAKKRRAPVELSFTRKPWARRKGAHQVIRAGTPFGAAALPVRKRERKRSLPTAPSAVATQFRR